MAAEAQQTSTFTDTQGRAWSIEIHPLAMKRVRERTGVVIGTLLEEQFKGLHTLFADPVLLADVLYVLCQEEAEKRQVSPEDFGRSLGRGVLEDAADAFVQALADFSRGQVRQPLKALAAKEREFREAMTAAALAEVAAVDVAKVVEAMTATSKAGAGSSPASAESTGAGSRCGSSS